MWIETKDKMPEYGVPVLVFVQGVYGNKTRRLRASYAAKHTQEQSELADGDADYDEATDEYYCPEGWYETNEFEEVHWRVEGEVTHWMPLPEPPLVRPDFEREFRYLVMKFKDVNKYLTDTEKEMLLAITRKIAKGRCDDIKMPLDCVVVESDWPEYEPTWKAIEERLNAEA